MLWLKWCIVPTLFYEVIVADVVYPAILLTFNRNIALFSTMVHSESASGINQDVLQSRSSGR